MVLDGCSNNLKTIELTTPWDLFGLRAYKLPRLRTVLMRAVVPQFVPRLPLEFSFASVTKLEIEHAWSLGALNATLQGFPGLVDLQVVLRVGTDDDSFRFVYQT